MYRCNNGVFYSIFPPFTRGNRCSPGKSMGFLRQKDKLGLNFHPVSDIIGNVECRCDGMVDVTDSKSVGGDTVWVRVPPPAPKGNRASIGCPVSFWCTCDLRLFERCKSQCRDGVHQAKDFPANIPFLAGDGKFSIFSAIQGTSERSMKQFVMGRKNKRDNAGGSLTRQHGALYAVGIGDYI